MARISVSIPDDLAEVEERQRGPRSGNFVERSRRIRASGPPVSNEEISRARQELRD
jgi:hypothetical protein